VYLSWKELRYKDLSQCDGMNLEHSVLHTLRMEASDGVVKIKLADKCEAGQTFCRPATIGV